MPSLAGLWAMTLIRLRVLLLASRSHGMVCRQLPLLTVGAANDKEHARLFAVSTKESGTCNWLRALPVSALGLRMDDNTMRVSVGLHLGTAICGPHILATDAVLRWMTWGDMRSAAREVRVDTKDMQH